LYAEGVAESYPQYLIESDMDNVRYVYSRKGADSIQTGDGSILLFTTYLAVYQALDVESAGLYAQVQVTDQPKLLFDTLLFQWSLLPELTIDPIVLEGHQYYRITDTKNNAEYMFWRSGEVVVLLEHLQNDKSARLFNAYARRYAAVSGQSSTVYLGLQEPQGIFVNERSFVIELQGANPEEKSAVLAVNGSRKSVKVWEGVTLNGLPLCLNDLDFSYGPNMSVINVTAMVVAGSTQCQPIAISEPPAPVEETVEDVPENNEAVDEHGDEFVNEEQELN
jgi:hypothetical protein